AHDNWAWPYISSLVCRGVVSGYADRTFHPGAATSRVQFLAMLGRAEGWNLVFPDTPTFSDVPPTFWGYGYIETAVRNGTVTGYADGTFHPVDYINRAQVAKMLVQSLGWLSGTPTPTARAPTFRDVPPSYWAYPFISAAAAHGL